MICLMIHYKLQHGKPYNWTMNWIKPLHKGGDADNVNNYPTIMVGSIMTKFIWMCKLNQS